MRGYHNIDKHTWRQGVYIGYADGAWRIRRDGTVWAATKQQGSGYVTGRTLADISKRLDSEASARAKASQAAALPNPFGG